MPHHSPQRRLVQLAIAERRYHRQPKAAQLFSQIGHQSISSWVGREDGTNKKPRPSGGGLGSAGFQKFQRAGSQIPRGGGFFNSATTHGIVIIGEWCGLPRAMSTVLACGSYYEPFTTGGTKKSRARRARLRYWPREADTITFQEGLLNARATGGGGQMRNTN